MLKKAPMTAGHLRVVGSVLLLSFWSFATFTSDDVRGLELGKVAALQLRASDAAYYASIAQTAFWSRFGMGTGLLVLLLVALWWAPLRRAMAVVAPVAILAAVACGPKPAFAYYAQQDYAEPYLIMPNESAFWVPDVGDNKTAQQAFDSSEYLNANKIATKRFLIPHAKLSGSAFWSWSNYYVPTGRLYIVDRSPYNQEWVSNTAKGTSARDEGFRCQSSEGLDINVGITISAYVTEENAAKFLFHYGVKPPAGSRTDPEVIFTSVLYGRSLTDVMQSNVRNAVQALVCRQLAGHTLVEDNAQANAIMDSVQKDITAFLTEKGITLDFIGWADTFTFDPKVQDALNRTFVAAQDQAIATSLATHTSTIQALAVAEALRGRWNGVAPSSVALTFVPDGMTNALGSLFAGKR